MKKDYIHKIYIGVVIFVILIVFANFFVLYDKARDIDPKINLSGFPVKFLGDYFTNIYRIKLGQEGTLFYTNAYSNENSPPVFFEPHYNIVGMITKPLGVDPFVAYELFHFITIILFILAIASIIAALFPFSLQGRILAFILFLTSTSIWVKKIGFGMTGIVDPPTYSDYFNVFTKINNMKAHHLLAQAAMMSIFFLLSYKKISKTVFILLFILSFSLGFLHPYLGVYTGLFVFLYTVLKIVTKDKDAKLYSMASSLIICTLIPIVIYHGFVLNTYWQTDVDMGGTTVWAPRGYSVVTYLMALGPVFFLSLPSFFIQSIRSKKIFPLLALWGFLPLILFFLPDIRIPMSAYRLFQSYQVIPLAMLSAGVLLTVSSKLKIPAVISILAISIAFAAYAIPPYREQFIDHTHPDGYFFYSQGLLQKSLPIFALLNEKTPKDSVVIASELVSQLIPIFTHNKVLMAHPGTNPDHKEKSRIGYNILVGNASAKELLEEAKKYNVSYILFGTETSGSPAFAFRVTPYTTLPFLKEIAIHNDVSIVKVDLSYTY